MGETDPVPVEKMLRDPSHYTVLGSPETLLVLARRATRILDPARSEAARAVRLRHAVGSG